jgi:hypothetical protein
MFTRFAQKLKGILFSLGVTLLLGLLATPVGASFQTQSVCGEELDWLDRPWGSFVFVFTADNTDLVQEFLRNFEEPLTLEFQKYTALFGTELEIPITIRIYPSLEDYNCLNALAPVLGVEDTHSHIGGREIALIGETINADPALWYSTARNAMRHEIAILFAEKLTESHAPPGLLNGVGGYFEDPYETFEGRYTASGNIQQPGRSMQRLMEDDIPASDDLVLLQQTSIVAYLIDVYGWENFLSFLSSIGESASYRQSFISVYGLNIQEIQAEWENYFSLYVADRWQANIVYAYDLDRYDVLIGAGAYEDALSGLQAAEPIVNLFGDADEIARVDELLRIANQGVMAGSLTLEARQAILDGNYAACIEKAEQAISIYNQLGDTRRISELEVYRDTAFEILTLRAELDSLKGFDTPLDPQKTQRILRIGRRLSELGDAEGVQDVQVTMILLSTGQRYFVEWTTIIGLLICVFIIYRRVRALFRKQPPEVNLL